MNKINITIQETSNPSILKFEADAFLTKYESFEFNTVDEADISPIAQQCSIYPLLKKYIYRETGFDTWMQYYFSKTWRRSVYHKC